jgi:hypothetical protein
MGLGGRGVGEEIERERLRQGQGQFDGRGGEREGWASGEEVVGPSEDVGWDVGSARGGGKIGWGFRENSLK